MVTWWSVLDDVPREVVMVLEFLASNFQTLGHAFESIDVNKDKSLTYREFMSGMSRKMRDIGFGLSPEAREALKRRKKQEEEEREARRRNPASRKSMKAVAPKELEVEDDAE